MKHNFWRKITKENYSFYYPNTTTKENQQIKATMLREMYQRALELVWKEAEKALIYIHIYIYIYIYEECWTRNSEDVR